MRTPEIRDELMRIADELEQPLLFPISLAEHAARLRHLVHELHKRPPVTKAPVVSRRMSDEVRALIWRIHLENPEMTQEQIGRRVGVAGGRVSETLAGKRR